MVSMKKREKVSIAIAAYNGEKYIYKQLRSILDQLKDEDEIVISLDPSTDRTEEIIENMNDKRIRVIDGPGKGLIKNFENAIKNTRNDVIFLSDQDDVWETDKVETVLNAINGYDLILHDALITDKNLKVIEDSVFKKRTPALSFKKNVIKNCFMGCCMAFRENLKKDILPFPAKIPMHDQWIGLVALKKGRVRIVSKPLILYRRHGNNESNMNHASIPQMIRWRIDLLNALKERGLV